MVLSHQNNYVSFIWIPQIIHILIIVFSSEGLAKYCDDDATLLPISC